MKKEIQFNVGDAILFNSFLLHRGKFENQINKKSRKCIQIFEIIPNKQDYDHIMNNILTIPGAEESKSLLFLIQSYYKI